MTIQNHGEWVEFYNANISAFARTQIREDDLERAASGDFYAREYVASESSYYARLEQMTDAELVAFRAEAEAAHRRSIELDDPSEYDVNDYESYYAERHTISELLAHRAAQARYTNPVELTYSLADRVDFSTFKKLAAV